MRSSTSELNHHDPFDGVVVACRPRAKGRLSLDRAIRPNVLATLPDDGRVHIRLAIPELRCGAWISTREGQFERLWVVEAISTGAGDGCVELTLVPKLL